MDTITLPLRLFSVDHANFLCDVINRQYLGCVTCEHPENKRGRPYQDPALAAMSVAAIYDPRAIIIGDDTLSGVQIGIVNGSPTFLTLTGLYEGNRDEAEKDIREARLKGQLQQRFLVVESAVDVLQAQFEGRLIQYWESGKKHSI